MDVPDSLFFNLNYPDMKCLFRGTRARFSRVYQRPTDTSAQKYVTWELLYFIRICFKSCYDGS